jgi:hypothetical protein
MSTGFYSSISTICVLLLPRATHALRDHDVQETWRRNSGMSTSATPPSGAKTNQKTRTFQTLQILKVLAMLYNTQNYWGFEL